MLDENSKMTDCYFEKKDWRACAEEVSLQFAMLQFMLSLYAIW